MATKTTIEWTEMSWNPVTGCSKISQGCKNCYAERMALRLQAMGQERYRKGFRVNLQPDALDQPDKWTTARTIFVNSMSDLFHENVPTSYIEKVFATIQRNPHHTFQVLTKRSGRLAALASRLTWPHNLWMGVSVEDSRVIGRIRDLLRVPAAVRFLSCEPLIGPLDNLPLYGIHWVIVGGESGPGARPMEKSWVTAIQEQCVTHHVAFFFKQWGGVKKKRNGRILNGRTYDELPQPKVTRVARCLVTA
jgi:protein gp37